MYQVNDRLDASRRHSTDPSSEHGGEPTARRRTSRRLVAGVTAAVVGGVALVAGSVLTDDPAGKVGSGTLRGRDTDVPTVEEAAASAVEGVTFEDPDGRYVLDIGTDWERVESIDGVDQWFVEGLGDDFRSNVTVVTGPVPAGMDFETYALTSLEQVQLLDPSIEVDYDRFVDGPHGELHEARFSGVIFGQDLEVITFLTVEDDRAALVQLAVDDGSLELLDTLRPFLETLRITEPTPSA